MTTVPFHSKTSAATLLSRLTRDKTRPISAMLEIADRCNEVCVHCYQIQGRKGELQTDDWRQIMDELAEMGVLFLTLSGGEATLRKDFLELVRYAREKKFAVKLYTNGLTMTDELAQALADLAVQEVQISLYSPRAEVHDWVTGVPGSWDKAVLAAERLVTRDVAVVLKTPLMSFNFDDRYEYVELAARLGADYMFDIQVDPREDGDRGPQSFALTDGQWMEAGRDQRLMGRRFAKPPRERDPSSSVCGACSGSVHVEPNGQLNPCALLEVPLGDARSEGVRRIWRESSAALDVRELTWADLPACRECDLNRFCSRCFSNARNEAGDALGPYASACRAARHKYELVHDERLEAESDVGPYRIDDGVLRSFAVELTEADRALRARLGWTTTEATPEPGPAGPGQLVQIRRPGAKRSRPEAVPQARPRDEFASRVAQVGVDSRRLDRQTDRGLD